MNSTLNEVIERQEIPSLIVLLERISAIARNDEIVRSADAVLAIIRTAPVMEAQRKAGRFWERIELAANTLRAAIEENSVGGIREEVSAETPDAERQSA